VAIGTGTRDSIHRESYAAMVVNRDAHPDVIHEAAIARVDLALFTSLDCHTAAASDCRGSRYTLLGTTDGDCA
jgi:hypothetical protein